MEKGRKKGVLARGLLRLGSAIRFAPKTEYLPPLPEREEEKKRSFLPPFLDTAHRLRLKNVAARASEQSFLLNALRSFTRALFGTRLRSYGLMLFLCGLVTALSYFASNVTGVFNGTVEHLVMGIAEITSGVWMAFDRLTLAGALKRSVFFRRILRPLFGFEEWEIPEGSGREKPVWTALAGLLIGALSAVFSPSEVFSVLLCAVLVLTVFYKPETGLLLLALSLLFLPAQTGAILIGVTWISFFCKVLVGKRSLKFGKTDLLLIPTVIWIFVGSGDFGRSLRLIALVSLTVLSCNLIRTLENTRRLALNLAVGLGAAAAVLALRELLFSLFPYDSWQNAAVFVLLKRQGDVFLLLTVLMPVLCGAVRSSGKFSARALGLFAAAACFFALWAHADPFLWIALAAGLWIFYLLSYRSALLVSVIAFLLGGAVLPLLPGGALRAIAGFFGGSGEMWGRLHQGLLLSAGQFSAALPMGTGLSGVRDLSGITGIYFEIGILFGILGAAVFYILLFSFFFRCVAFERSTTRREIHPLVLGSMCGILTFLVAGFFVPFTAETTAALFFLLLSFPKAAHRAAEREETRLPY